MGIKAADIVDQIEVVRTYPLKYVDEAGQPIRFVYLFREPSQEDINRHQRRRPRKSKKSEEAAQVEATLEQFCEFIVDVPEGFDDIKRTRENGEAIPASEWAHGYFGQSPKMARFVTDAVNGLMMAVLPKEGL